MLMIFNPRTPIIVGSFLVFLLVWMVMVYAPMPASLSAPHAALTGMATIDTCESCHSPTGLDDGCMSCHKEIRQQLRNGTGYHGYLAAQGSGSCGSCHSEHHGPNFPLISQISWGSQTEGTYDHAHVDFLLHGKHDKLPCEKCHTVRRSEPFTLANFPSHPRERTFLGLDQDCASCHQDIHSGGLTGTCSDCHGQEAFDPPEHFDHSEHFALVGGHADLECSQCHVIPDEKPAVVSDTFPFDKVRGTTCGDCHDSPHQVAFSETCEACHDGNDPDWTRASLVMTPDRHLETGFPLVAPHASVTCASCHSPELSFQERHPDPHDPAVARTADQCQSCHEDVHNGQFGDRYDGCLDCHQQESFLPTTFGHLAHNEVFPIQGAHVAVPCVSCHTQESDQPRQFAGLSHDCKSCHEDPHAGQFAEELRNGDCTSCHEPGLQTFHVASFDHGVRTGYALEGSHAQASCEDCHFERTWQIEGETVTARQFRDTPQDCASCHKDVHRGQFADYGACETCHTSFTYWHHIQFDHDTQSRFPLRGVHASVSCNRCHVPIELEDGSKIVQYKPLGRECRDCHEIQGTATQR